jgi:hypothetical protein
MEEYTYKVSPAEFRTRQENEENTKKAESDEKRAAGMAGRRSSRDENDHAKQFVARFGNYFFSTGSRLLMPN